MNPAMLFLVALGGSLGAVMRFLVSALTTRLAGPWFPYGTLLVNVAGSLLIGLVGGLAESRLALSAQARATVMVGFLGGLTTFSTFGYETLELWRNGQTGGALLNVALQVALGLGGVWLGHTLSRLAP